jgi:hypothetical protein
LPPESGQVQFSAKHEKLGSGLGRVFKMPQHAAFGPRVLPTLSGDEFNSFFAG